jgi:hypothetical protein
MAVISGVVTMTLSAGAGDGVDEPDVDPRGAVDKDVLEL